MVSFQFHYTQKLSIPANGAHQKERLFKSCWKVSKTKLAKNGYTDYAPSSNGQWNDKVLTSPDTPAFQTDQLGPLGFSSSYREAEIGWPAISTSTELENNLTALQLAEQTFHSANRLLMVRFPASSPHLLSKPFARPVYVLYLDFLFFTSQWRLIHI